MKLKIPPVIITLFFATCMWLIDHYLIWGGLEFRGHRWLAFCVFAAGSIFGLLGLIQFYEQSTSIDPHKPGKASALVDGGIFKISRNPMYAGLLFMLASYGIYLGSLLSLLVLPAFIGYMNRYQIMPEEQVLTEKFRGEYEEYKSRVRRWL